MMSSRYFCGNSMPRSTKRGLCQLVMHPFVIGYRSRIWILDELLRHARSRGDVFIGTHAAVAAHAKQNG